MFYLSLGPRVCGGAAGVETKRVRAPGNSSPRRMAQRLARRRQGARRLAEDAMMGVGQGGETPLKRSAVAGGEIRRPLESYTKRSIFVNSYASTENVYC